MSIAATRMHRSLVDFASGHADMYDIIYSALFSAHCLLSILGVLGNQQSGSLPVRRIQETNHDNGASAPVDQMGVAVHTAPEQYGTPQIEDNTLVIFTDKQCTSNQAD